MAYWLGYKVNRIKTSGILSLLKVVLHCIAPLEAASFFGKIESNKKVPIY
jgi:hypothetical protein